MVETAMLRLTGTKLNIMWEKTVLQMVIFSDAVELNLKPCKTT